MVTKNIFITAFPMQSLDYDDLLLGPYMIGLLNKLMEKQYYHIPSGFNKL